MSVPMNSSSFRSVVEPILSEVFDGLYDQRDDEWKQVFDMKTGTPRNFHEEPVLYGMGAAPELPDGSAVTYAGGGVLFIQRYVYRVYGLAYALTRVLVEDGDHIRLGTIMSEHLAQSMAETKETLCANVMNRAFNASFPGGDAVALVSLTHPLAPGGTYSNRLATDAALSQTSLEQMLIQVRNAVDNNGKRIKLIPKQIVCGPSLVFQAETLLKTSLRVGTANNDINPVKSMGLLGGGQANLARITSTTAWWIQTSAQKNGLKLMMRRKLDKGMEGDFDTDSMRYKATERYAVGFTDPRCLFGTPGL